MKNLLEKEDGSWRMTKTKLGLLVGNVLFIGPAYQPDEYNELRPRTLYYFLPIIDVALLLKYV